jgi:hypothetical protein
MATDLLSAYRTHAAWEPWEALDARTAALLPGLLLARVDGKSPVEYVTDDDTRDAIRRFAKQYLERPAAHVETIVHAFSP